jgi:AcrR family transcriptional regulator
MSGKVSKKASPSRAKAAPTPLPPNPHRPAAKRKQDRRILQTRDALGDAMVALMQEKSFESITVQHVLDRAGIGRSTFYAHYRDKNDLFFSDVDDFWQKAATSLWRLDENSTRVAPVRELLTHVADVRDFYNALVTSGRVHDVMELGEGHFARSIEQRLAHFNRRDKVSAPRAVNPQPAAPAAADISRKVLAQALAGALFSLLRWWIVHGKPVPADQMDTLYHQLVWTGAATQPPLAATLRKG